MRCNAFCSSFKKSIILPRFLGFSLFISKMLVGFLGTQTDLGINVRNFDQEDEKEVGKAHGAFQFISQLEKEFEFNHLSINSKMLKGFRKEKNKKFCKPSTFSFDFQCKKNQNY